MTLEKNHPLREALGIVGEGLMDESISQTFDIPHLLTLQGMLAEAINAAYAVETGQDPLEYLRWLDVDAKECLEAQA